VVGNPVKMLQDARKFRVNAIGRTEKNSLDLQDRVDIWKINNKFKSSFNLALKGISKNANIDVALLNKRGQVITASLNRKNQTEQLTVALETGTFYVQVKLRSGAKSQYALTLSTAPAADPISNIGFETATALRGNPVTDFVGNNDPDDYFGIVPLVSGQLKLNLSGLSNDANVEVYDKDRRLISSSRNSGATPETLQQSVTSIAGSPYFVRVAAALGKETNYTLTYSFTPGNVTSSASGLQYIDVFKGTGATPKPGQTLKVQYTGILTDGSKFDSSRDRNKAFSFTLGIGQVIKGWDEGFSTMKVGGRRQLIIPPSLGYGSAGAGSSIPPNATLVFDVELLEIT
jgi:FKBP-type peptidyl-prolyl cis-trans isomerase